MAQPDAPEEEKSAKGGKRDPLPQEFAEEMEAKGRTFKSPTTGNMILFRSLPWEDQRKYLQKWLKDQERKGKGAKKDTGSPEGDDGLGGKSIQRLPSGDPSAVGDNLHPHTRQTFSRFAEEAGLDDAAQQEIQKAVVLLPAKQVDTAATEYQKEVEEGVSIFEALINFVVKLGLDTIKTVQNFIKLTKPTLKTKTKTKTETKAMAEGEQQESLVKVYLAAYVPLEYEDALRRDYSRVGAHLPSGWANNKYNDVPYHVTFAYLGKVPISNLFPILLGIIDYVQGHLPIPVQLSGDLTTFTPSEGSDHQVPIFATFNATSLIALQRFREGLWSKIKPWKASDVVPYPEFTPHVNLGYAPDSPGPNKPLPQLTSPVSWILDRVHILTNDYQTYDIVRLIGK